MSDFFPTEVWTLRAAKHRLYKPLFRHISYKSLGLLSATSDFVLILVASVAAGVAYHLFVLQIEGDIEAFAFVGLYSGLMFVLLTNACGLYRPRVLLSASTQFRGIATAWGAVLLFMASVLFLLKTGANYSRGATIAFGLSGFGFILASRIITRMNFRLALANGTLVGQRAIVVGDCEELAAKSSDFLLQAYGAREVGCFELSPIGDRTATDPNKAIIEAAIRAAKCNSAEYVLLALRWTDTWRRDLICERLRALPLPVLLLPDRFVTSVFAKSPWWTIAEAPIEVQRAPLSRDELLLKRIFDLTLGFLASVALVLPAAVICAAIALDSPGPILFRQRRKGFNGREFAIYKFRTMKVLEDGPTIPQARRNDPRVTRVGRLLRMTSLDEVPQLINVLKGEMSLVGPRPHAIAHDDEYSDSIKRYAFRHHVKPGITGWAQVNGFRGETAEIDLMKKRVQHDLWYINNWCFWLDLRIIARTFIEILRPRNAH